jgi:hypothetical protein
MKEIDGVIASCGAIRNQGIKDGNPGYHSPISHSRTAFDDQITVCLSERLLDFCGCGPSNVLGYRMVL